jgi:hypothetical protein
VALDGLVKYRDGVGITTPMRLAPASRSARRPAENVNSMGSTLGLSAYLLKVFCEGPVQKVHVVKI